MKYKLYSTLLIISVLFGCKNERIIEGNYAVCYNNEYSEVYFEKDSMRVASDNEWVKLTNWRKIEIINDTLHFESFGEWGKPVAAKIEYGDLNKINLQILNSDENLILESLSEKIKFENLKEFWAEFYQRQNVANCN